jgi:hypothetical protein
MIWRPTLGKIMSRTDFRGQFSDHSQLPGLPDLTEQIGEVTHMCPEPDCMNISEGQYVPLPFCPVCLGAGTITTERLARWQLGLISKVNKL